MVGQSSAAERRAERLWAEGTILLAERELRERRIEATPDEADAISRRAARTRRWCAALDLELGRVAAAARGSGLASPVLIKGPAVARHYPDPALRPYSDIDLLVPEHELDRWIALLSGLGYVAPDRWDLDLQRRFTHHVKLRRPSGEGSVVCELHRFLFLERRARRLDHAALVPLSEPSRWDGVLWPRQPALLVVLALHLAHHELERRRDISVRDFVELGSPAVVAEARSIAERLEVGWALELALAEAERMVGEARWGAAPPAPTGLTAAGLLPRAGMRRTFAEARELGPVQGARYLAHLLSPRRFGSASEVAAYLRRQARRARATNWLGRR